MKLALLGLLALAGCISPEERYARQQAQEEQAQARQAAYTANLRRQCEAIGYTTNTDPWRQCIMQLHGQNQAQNAQLQGIILQEAIRQSQPQPYRPVVPAPRMPTQTNCQTDRFGNTNCTSY